MNQFSKRLEQLSRRIPKHTPKEAQTILNRHGLIARHGVVTIVRNLNPNITDDEIAILESTHLEINMIVIIYPDGTIAPGVF